MNLKHDEYYTIANQKEARYNITKKTKVSERPQKCGFSKKHKLVNSNSAMRMTWSDKLNEKDRAVYKTM